MSRPALEVADVVRARGREFLKRFKSSRSYQLLKAFRAVERCRTAALGGHKDKCVAAASTKRPSLITPADHDAVPSARHRPDSDGSRHGNGNCSPPTTSMSPHRASRTGQRVCSAPARRSSTTCCSRPAPRRCWKWRLTRSSSAPRSVSFRSCIRGDRTCFFIHISTVSCPPADCLRTISAGYTLHPLFLVPVPSLRIAFRTRSSQDSSTFYGKGLLEYRGPASACKDPGCVRRDHGATGRKSAGSSTSDRPSAVLNRCCAIPRPLHPSRRHLQPPPGQLQRKNTSAFAGRIMPTAQQTEHHEAQGNRRVPAPLLPPRAAKRLRAQSSATTACSPTASANSACPWRKTARRRWSLIRFPSPRRKIRPNALHSGTVRSAVAPCAWREDLRQRNYPWAEIPIPHEAWFDHRPPTCFSHVCASVCSALHMRPLHPSALFIYRARQAATRSSTHRPPSSSAPIHPAEAHTPFYKQHSIPIIPASLTASAKYASGFLQTSLSKTPRTKFRGLLQPRLRGVSDQG